MRASATACVSPSAATARSIGCWMNCARWYERFATPRAAIQGKLMTARTAQIKRDTAETKITLGINRDGSGMAQLSTGVGFFDHMLNLLARHSLIDLDVEAQGDLHIDEAVP